MAPSSETLLERNTAYAMSHRPLPSIEEIESMGAPPPKTCVITCVDPRVFPEQLLDLKMGEAFLFRTIAGHPQPVFDDVVTLDAVSQGFQDLILVYHTDCGAHYFDTEQIRSHLSKLGPGAMSKIDNMSFGAISTSIEDCLRDDIRWLKEQPLLRRELAQAIKGYVFDIKTGFLRGV